MVDFLSGVDSDSGSKEPTPVTIVAGGAEVQMDLRARGAAAFTTVASGIASVAILAANAARRGAIIVNTDANILYLDLTGGAASAARHAAALAANGSFQVPFGFTGAISGVWAADGTGSALVTEFV